MTIESAASTPGIAASQKMMANPCRSPLPLGAMLTIARAANGPATAPAVSAASSKPNARPRADAGTESVSRASCRGDLSPRPAHPTVRTMSSRATTQTAHRGPWLCPSACNPPRPTADDALPDRRAIRRKAWRRSKARRRPLQSRQERTAGAPIAVKNSGRIAVPASWPKSDKNRLMARPMTFRLSQPGAFVASSSFMRIARARNRRGCVECCRDAEGPTRQILPPPLTCCWECSTFRTLGKQPRRVRCDPALHRDAVHVRASSSGCWASDVTRHVVSARPWRLL